MEYLFIINRIHKFQFNYYSTSHINFHERSEIKVKIQKDFSEYLNKNKNLKDRLS